jgi:hypothetical protein
MADSKIIDLAAGTPSATDVLIYVSDPGGSPVDKKTTVTNLLSGAIGLPATEITETSGPTDLAIAAIADGQFLKRSGTDVIGAAQKFITNDPAWAAKGDLIVATGNDTAAVLTAGANSKIIAYDSSQASGFKQVYRVDDRQFVIGDGANAITTGVMGFMRFPEAFKITGVVLLADASGSIVVDIWKDTFANFPPTIADTITASAKPTLSSAQSVKDETLTGWTVDVAADDVLAFNVDSASTVKQVTIQLYGYWV